MNISDLDKGSHIHLMGICGVAMASLAGMLQDLGFKVSGSDQNVYPPMSTQLESLGIKIQEGYKKENLEPRPDFVIVGNVISRTHEEAEALLDSDIPYTSLPKAMGDIAIANRKSIVISGTHGKTTTTSIMAWICQSLNLEPGFMIGGIAKNFNKSFQVAKGDYFVIEGDEYDTAFFDKVPKFNHYKPYYVLLGSIEFDHADIYNDMSDVIKAFEGLADRAHPEGVFIYNADSISTSEIAKKAPSKTKRSYGLQAGDYNASNVRYDIEAMRFDFQFQGEKVLEVETSLFGDYNLLNLLSCLALAHSLDWDMQAVGAAIKSFEGVKRRQEILSKKDDIYVIEDFAHHPTAVELTIQAVKKRFHKGRVIAVFEPRSATSRRKVFQQDYVRALSFADLIFVKEAGMQDKIKAEDRFSSADLVHDLQAKGCNAHLFQDVNSAAMNITAEARTNDAIVLMSNGSFDGIYSKVLEAL